MKIDGTEDFDLDVPLMRSPPARIDGKEQSPRRERPARTGYNDAHGVYHPGPDSRGFDAHADQCAKCEAERRDPARGGYTGTVPAISSGVYR